MSSVQRKPIAEGGVIEIERRDMDRAIPGRPIDLVHLARQSLGDRGLETDLLSLFDRQAASILCQIKAAPREGGQKLLGDLVHTLKGSARAVGAIGVAAAARACEDELGSQGFETSVDKLAVAVGEARAAIADLLADR
jgi:HPt (histidine-containing phosphotransfer) domain-containing protein